MLQPFTGIRLAFPGCMAAAARGEVEEAGEVPLTFRGRRLEREGEHQTPTQVMQSRIYLTTLAHLADDGQKKLVHLGLLPTELCIEETVQYFSH